MSASRKPVNKAFSLILDRIREIELILHLGLELSESERQELVETLDQLKNALIIS